MCNKHCVLSHDLVAIRNTDDGRSPTPRRRATTATATEQHSPPSDSSESHPPNQMQTIDRGTNKSKHETRTAGTRQGRTTPPQPQTNPSHPHARERKRAQHRTLSFPSRSLPPSLVGAPQGRIRIRIRIRSSSSMAAVIDVAFLARRRRRRRAGRLGCVQCVVVLCAARPRVKKEFIHQACCAVCQVPPVSKRVVARARGCMDSHMVIWFVIFVSWWTCYLPSRSSRISDAHVKGYSR